MPTKPSSTFNEALINSDTFSSFHILCCMFIQLLLRANCTIRTGGNCQPLAGLSGFTRVRLGRSPVIAGVPAMLLLRLEGSLADWSYACL